MLKSPTCFLFLVFFSATFSPFKLHHAKNPEDYLLAKKCLFAKKQGCFCYSETTASVFFIPFPNHLTSHAPRLTPKIEKKLRWILPGWCECRHTNIPFCPLHPIHLLWHASPTIRYELIVPVPVPRGIVRLLICHPIKRVCFAFYSCGANLATSTPTYMAFDSPTSRQIKCCWAVCLETPLCFKQVVCLYY